MPRPPLSQDDRDVHFLTEEFGIPPFKAAHLVTRRTDLAEQLTENEWKRQHDADPLADLPTPKPPQHDYVADADEDQLKPITDHNNLRGAG